jgi:hypothetical protein
LQGNVSLTLNVKDTSGAENIIGIAFIGWKELGGI